MSEPTPLWRADFRLSTTMWNEGFEKARLPWIRFYTDDDAFVQLLPKTLKSKDKWTDFLIEVTRVVYSREEFEVEVEEYVSENFWPDDDTDSLDNERRYQWLVGVDSRTAITSVQNRMDEWEGG